MAVAQYIQTGNSINHTPQAALTAGDVVVIGDLVAVAKLDIAAGQLGALALEGVFEVPKEAAAADKAIAAGVKVYWNATDKRVETTPGDPATHKYMGKTITAALTTDTTTQVRLEQ
jgi:predicted RecA/RadA family phage recombinase